MSLAERQTISLLAIVSGCLNTIEDFNLDPDNMAIILYAKDVCDKTTKFYPCSGNERKTQKWIISRMKLYDIELTKRKDEKYLSILLVSMAQQILEDLLAKIKDSKKRELILPVNEAIMALHDKIDPLGNRIEEYIKANELLEIAYKILRFEL